jgi:hypothetical protein
MQLEARHPSLAFPEFALLTTGLLEEQVFLLGSFQIHTLKCCYPNSPQTTRPPFICPDQRIRAITKLA